MNKEYIERELLLKGEYSFGEKGCMGRCSLCDNWTESGCKVILDIPIADVEPVRHGEWIHKNGELCCSVCGGEALMDEVYYKSPYCPDCGACMDGGSE